MEAMSGFSLADVVVHRNSAEPSRLGAAAFTQGNQIHLAPGEERHLPHEAWHVVQQAQGRVWPTVQMKGGVTINDDPGLEHEADAMANRAATGARRTPVQSPQARPAQAGTPPAQCALKTYDEIKSAAKYKKFNWTNLRTDTDNYDPAKVAKSAGLGVKTKNNKELKTDIEWKPVDSKAEEGKGVDAIVLGPDHMLGSEPATGSNKIWNQRRRDLSKAAGGKKYIAGHLLNNNLGGPGSDARNLTAIPATANTTQSSRIEEEVKTLVNKEYRFVRYKVDVDYAEDPKGNKPHYASKITSTWNALDEDGKSISPTKTVAITIPSPSSLAGTGVVSATDGGNHNFSTAAVAQLDPSKDAVLNEAGYLKIATSVQETFAASIERLRNKIAEDEKVTLKSDEERKEHLTRIAELRAELDENAKQLQETQEELSETSAQLLASESTNEFLLNELKTLQGAYAKSQAEILSLKSEIDQLKGVISQQHLDLLALLVSNMAWATWYRGLQTQHTQSHSTISNPSSVSVQQDTQQLNTQRTNFALVIANKKRKSPEEEEEKSDRK